MITKERLEEIKSERLEAWDTIYAAQQRITDLDTERDTLITT